MPSLARALRLLVQPVTNIQFPGNSLGHPVIHQPVSESAKQLLIGKPPRLEFRILFAQGNPQLRRQILGDFIIKYAGKSFLIIFAVFNLAQNRVLSRDN